MKKNVIYDNYNLNEYYNDAKNFLRDEYEIFKPSEEEIWNEIYEEDRICFEDEFRSLCNFFSDGTYLLLGKVGRWNGTIGVKDIFTNFEDEFYKMTKDCEYVKIWDENNHLYIQCSHHDGTNQFEIKKLTKKGEDYYERWNNNYNDSRDDEYIFEQLKKNYSVLPRYAKKVFGC